jgi:predicted metal-binding protein
MASKPLQSPSIKTDPIQTAKTRWKDVVLVCKKCSKKLDGGFGPDGDVTLKKALKRYLKPPKSTHAGKGRKAELVVKHTDCFDVCPKNAVIAVNAANPKALLIVPVGADLLEVKARLGLADGRRTKPSLSLIGD